jgi:FAD:protein FMN transferase
MRDEGKGTMNRREAIRITAVAGVSLAALGGMGSSLLRRARLQRVRVTRPHLGTIVTVTVFHADENAGHELVEKAFAEISRMEGILNRHSDSTPMAQLNREGTLANAPSELTHVLHRALEYSRLSDGAFDVTVAPVLTLYLNAHKAGTDLPSEAAVADALRLVDYRSVKIDGTTVSLAPGGSITMDAIAKGHVVDRAVAALVGGGAERVVVGAGGDMASGGTGTESWNVGIQNPRAQGTLGELVLTGECIATSGDYMQTFTADRRYNHIIDPRTGRSPEHTSAVTVIAQTAMDADALSTTTFVMGPEKGLVMLERLEGVEGLIVTKDQQQLATSGFGAYTV